MLEIELKLQFTPEFTEALLTHPLVKQYQEGSSTCTALKTIYFDTDEFELAKADAVLRIRKKDGKFIQTIKTKAPEKAGLQQRLEWDAIVETCEIDPSKIEHHANVVDLQPILEKMLKPVFKTEFERTALILNKGDTAVEMALDKGEITASENAESLCELELELMHGEIGVLFEIAHELSKTIPFQINPFSKAQRGYRLLKREKYPPLKSKQIVWETEYKTVEDGFFYLFSELFQAIQINALSTYTTGAAIEPLLSFMQRFKLLLNLIPTVFSRKTTKLMRATLDHVREALRLEQKKEPDVRNYLAVLQSSEYAQFCLECGVFLYAKLWRETLDKEAEKTLSEPLLEFVQTELKKKLIPLCRLKQKISTCPLSDIADQRTVATECRILFEWFLNLLKLENTEPFFTVLCQVEGLIEKSTIFFSATPSAEKVEYRMDLDHKLSELVKRATGLGLV